MTRTRDLTRSMTRARDLTRSMTRARDLTRSMTRARNLIHALIAIRAWAMAAPALTVTPAWPEIRAWIVDRAATRTRTVTLALVVTRARTAIRGLVATPPQPMARAQAMIRAGTVTRGRAVRRAGAMPWGQCVTRALDWTRGWRLALARAGTPGRAGTSASILGWATSATPPMRRIWTSA
jgi:hypothetical protein